MERESNIYFARLAEQGERYEDMINYMKIVAKVSLMPMTPIYSQAPSFLTRNATCSLLHSRIQLGPDVQHGELLVLFRTKKNTKPVAKTRST